MSIPYLLQKKHERYLLKSPKTNMGVRRLFSRGGQNFPGGSGVGEKTFSLPKNTLFSFKKSQKHTIQAGQGGGKCPLLPSPADAHENNQKCVAFRRLSNAIEFLIVEIANRPRSKRIFVQPTLLVRNLPSVIYLFLRNLSISRYVNLFAGKFAH